MSVSESCALKCAFFHLMAHKHKAANQSSVAGTIHESSAHDHIGSRFGPRSLPERADMMHQHSRAQ